MWSIGDVFHQLGQTAHAHIGGKEPLAPRTCAAGDLHRNSQSVRQILDQFLVGPPSFGRSCDSHSHRVAVKTGDFGTPGARHHPYNEQSAAGMTSHSPGCTHDRTIGRTSQPPSRAAAPCIVCGLSHAVGDLLRQVAPIIERVCSTVGSEVFVVDRRARDAIQIWWADLICQA